MLTTKRSILALTPLLAIYILLFAFLADSTPDTGDEGRYAMYAENLSNGFYAPPDKMLWNGPGYPLLLTPFAHFKISWYWAKALNPVFKFLSVCIMFFILTRYMSKKQALIGCYIFGLFPPAFCELPYLLTEPFILFLTSLFLLLTIKVYHSNKRPYIFAAAATLTALILTKIIIAYVIYALIVMALILWKFIPSLRKMLPVYLLSLFLCCPYLIYTYSITGKIMYWGNSGGTALYWMSNPDTKMLGTWRPDDVVFTDPDLASHRPLFAQLAPLDHVQKDAILKKKAIENILAHPAGYCFNLTCNFSRLILNFPFAKKEQKPESLLIIAPNGMMLGTMLLAAFPLFKFRNLLPPDIKHAIVFCLIFIAGQSLVYALARYFEMILPMIFFILWYSAANLVTLKPPTQIAHLR